METYKTYRTYCESCRRHRHSRPSQHHDTLVNGQRHAKRDLRTYAKSVDPDQLPRLRRRVWSGSALFDTRYINGTYISCCVNNLITYSCFQYRISADLGLHYLQCPKVPFRVTMAIYLSVFRRRLTCLESANNHHPSSVAHMTQWYGQRYTPDEQCQIKYGAQSYFCRVRRLL